jgi:hypothetical protein
MPSITGVDECRPLRRLPRSRIMRAAVLAAAGGLVLGFLPSAASAAPLSARPTIVAGPAVTAYAYANKPTSHSYTPEKDYSYNSTGETIRITKSGPGEYTVDFDGLGAYADQGTVDVSPEGFGAAVCSVTSWGPDSTGTILQVGVDCYALSGTRMNDYFEVAFTSGGSTSGTTDYVWANDSTAKSYTPNRDHQFNSSGGTNTIEKLGKGQYEVTMPGPVATDGTVKVTAYGTTSDACETDGWSAESPGQEVDVDCFNKAGQAANDRFTMTFTAANDLLGDGGASGYVWANEPSSSSYVPDTLYQYDTVGTQASVIMFTTGQWEVAFPSAGQGDTGDEQVTAYGSDDTHCVEDGPAGAVGGTESGDVYCFDNSGNPVNDYYTMQWLVN